MSGIMPCSVKFLSKVNSVEKVVEKDPKTADVKDIIIAHCEVEIRIK
jgi:hypothetical protein